MCVGVVCVFKCIREELDWVTNKPLWVISNKVSYTSKELKNKAILNLKQCCMCSYVVLIIKISKVLF